MLNLIQLPYAQDALEPVISTNTLDFHHGKHLKGYVDNLNKLIVGTPFEKMSLVDIVRFSDGPVFNNAGQVLNHNLYFKQFQNQASHQTDERICISAPKLSKQIEKQWGTIAAFKADFESMGTSLFGSGWVWLSAREDGSLLITQESGAGNPIRSGWDKSGEILKPILTFDVWEHAYYLDYQNRRAAYLQALWSIINWSAIEELY
ncbi:MAG: superoxide dismutase [Bacteroidales bacterium]|nr:superoxide dismutase [Bacteroidales bacterium]